MTESLTCACQLTPLGRSAVAVIELQGPASVSIMQSFFVSRFDDVVSMPIDRIIYGHWRDLSHENEDIVVVRRGGDHFEIHGHGGTAAPARLLQQLRESGVQIESPWHRLLKGSVDSIQAEAQWCLSWAPGERAAELLEWQAAGRLADSLRDCIEQCVAIQESREPNDSSSLSRLIRDVRGLLATSDVSRRAFRPTSIAIVGPANAGKSSLANALLGFERSLVFDLPGTTRDVVETTGLIAGWPFCLVDTAGEREDAASELERAGQQLGRQAATKADLILRVTSAVELNLESEPIVETEDVWQIVTKADLIESAVLETMKVSNRLLRQRTWTSVVEERGIEELLARIAKWLSRAWPSEPMAMLFTLRQRALAEKVLLSLENRDWDLAIVVLEQMICDQEAREPAV